MAGGHGDDHPGILYFYSESIGLGANGACASAASLANLGLVPRGASAGTLFVAIGGGVQMLCALRAFRSYDHFGATLAGFYSTFWALLGLEILLSTRLHLLHATALLIPGALLAIVAPLVNAYATMLVGAIVVASSLELALRAAGEDDASALEVAAATSELIVALVTLYGVLASVLHGVTERQVLPCFDDALVETVLWKRPALASRYSEGKWADPLPLGEICRAMGFWGMAARAPGSVLWFATYAAVLGLVSLVHGLRQEHTWVVRTVCDTCLFTILALDNDQYDWAMGVAFISCAVIHLFITGFSAGEKLSLIHLITSILEAASLLTAGIGSSVTDANSDKVTFVFYATSALTMYSGIAALANAQAQKELFPTGRPCFSGASTRDKAGEALQQRASNFFGVQSEHDEETGGLSRSVHSLRRATSKMVQAQLYDNDIDPDSEMDISPKYPGDHKLLGYSDFGTPLFGMFTGQATYALLMAIGMSADSDRTISNAALVLLVTHASSLLICASRGMTSFGFLCFAYTLEGALFVLTWLISSWGEFKLLSVTSMVHITGLFFYLMSEIVGRIVASVFFSLMFVISLATLGLLLGSQTSVICRLFLQHQSRDTDELCDIGFASEREQFDKCVAILKDGGVCCIPTDTVYCLACRANSPEAIKRIYGIKSRPAEKPLSLWLGSIDDIKNVSPEGKGWSPKLFTFMQKIWPGSVSLVVSRGTWLQRLGVGNAADLIGTPDSIALRVPNSTLTVSLLRESGPLAITSANPSGACDCTHHNKVDDLIASKIDFILADGASPMTIASSVVDVRDIDNHELFFYRVGCVPENYIWSLLNDTKEEAPPLLVHDVHSGKIRVINSVMSHMLKLVGCDSYRIYLLTQETKEGVMNMPWKELSPCVQNAFHSGVSYYDDGQGEEEQSQMVVPMRDRQGNIFAALKFLNKATNGKNIPFKKDDLAFANLASAILNDNVSTQHMRDDAPDWVEDVKVVVLSERGYFETQEKRLTVGGLSRRRNMLRRSSEGSLSSSRRALFGSFRF